MKKTGYLLQAYDYLEPLFFKEASYSGWGFTKDPEEADFFDNKEDAEEMVGCIQRGVFATYWDYDDTPPQPVVYPYTKNEI